MELFQATSVMTTVFEFAWKGVAVLLVAGVAAAILSNRSAAVRHLVWCSAMLALLAVPIVGSIVPDWQASYSFLPTFAIPATPSSGVDSTSPSIAATNEGDMMRTETVAPITSNVSHPESGFEAARPQAETSGPVLADAAIETGPVFTIPPVSTILFLAWILGVFVVLGDIATSHFSARRVTRRATRVSDPRILSVLAAAADRLKVAATVDLRYSRDVAVPCTWGAVRPSILLPEQARRWTDSRLKMVLAHELGHIKRLDWLTLVLTHIACAAHWFNPLAWVARRRMLEEQEAATDDLVLHSGSGGAQDYATNLLDIARASVGLRSNLNRLETATIAMSRPSSLEGRLRAILDTGRHRSEIYGRRVLTTAALVIVFLVPLAAIQPAPNSHGEAVGASRAAITSIPTSERMTRSVSQAAPETPASDARATLRRATAEATAGSTGEATAGATGEGTAAATADATAGANARATAGAADDSAGDSAADLNPQTSMPAPASKAIDDVLPALNGDLAAAFVPSDADSAKVRLLLDALAAETDAEVRVYLVRILGDLGHPMAIGGIGNVLSSDASSDARATAAWALGEIGDAGSVAVLSRALQNDSSVEVRRQVVWALGAVGSGESAPALERTLATDASADVREYAAWALGELESPSSVDALEKALGDASDAVRLKAAWALGEIKSDRSAAALERLLSDSSKEVRRYAAHALGEIGQESSVQPLLGAVRDEDPEVRSSAIFALGEIGSLAAVEALSRALEDSNTEVRSRAAWSLAEIGSEGAADALIKAVADDDADVRRNVARALGEIKVDKAADVLMGMLRNDPDPDVRKTAAMALSNLDF